MIKQAGEKETIEKPQGGEGSIEISRIVSQNDNIEGMRLFARVTVQPKSTIAYHIHKDESEVYYVLRGKGIFLDHGGKRVHVKAGDFCMIQKGQGHGMENPYEEEIDMIALVF